LFPGVNFTAGNANFYIGGFGFLPMAFQFAAQSGAFQPQQQQPLRPGESLASAQMRAFFSRMFFMIGVLVFVVIVLY
jgi:hypothetical protein